MWQTLKSIKAAVRFHDYKPKPLTWLSASRWVDQFDAYSDDADQSIRSHADQIGA